MNKEIFSFIKSQWDCVTYANKVLGLPVFKDGDRCVSPLRPDAKNPTSFVVFKDFWHDFGSDSHGDVIDLCALARHNGNISEAMRELAGQYFQNIGYEWEKHSAELDDKISKWHAALRPEDIEYLHSRRIHDDTIERLRIGFRSWDCRLVIPYFKNDKVVYYASRDRSGTTGAHKYEKAPITEYNEHVPWGLHSLTNSFDELHPDGYVTSSQGVRIILKKYLCVLEGMFDVMSFEQEGFHVLSPIGGYFNKQQIGAFLAHARHHDFVFICFDNDASGNSFRKRMAEICFSNRINFICGQVPAGIKDVSDYYAAGGNLADLVADSKKGLQFLANLYDSKEDFSAFMRKASRYAFKADIWDMISNAVQFPTEWRKALFQECSAAPRESLIVDDVANNHELKYIVADSFYEYSAGIWRKIPDEFAKKYIEDSLGNFATGSRLNNICGFLKTRLASQEVFNNMHAFNFINGVLDLESGKLLPHSKSFMMNVQAPYVYNPSADYPLWRKFLGQVMEDVPEKLLLLQELAGYVLFPDCRHEKSFMLLGDGSNGKSVFINTLQSVFGESNCSNVTISELVNPFDPIRLKDSIANFSTEMKSDVKGASEKFKQAVSGEPLTASYKGKDAITFRPRAKWVFSANNFIVSNDISHGFTRRVIFIKFKRKFSEEEADKELSKKLRAELPGIFNWVYAGYRRLLSQQTFTYTGELKELTDDFISGINPTYAFIDEKVLPITAPILYITPLYDQYKEWCQKAGHKAAARLSFTRNFREIVERFRPDIQYHKGGADGTYFSFDVKIPF